METNQIAVIMKSPKVKDAPETRLKQIIAQNYFRKGIGIEPQTLELVVKDMKQIIFDDFHYLTIEEIAFAFREGVLGKYGAYYGVNIQSMYEWLSAYCVSDERVSYIQKLNMENALKALPPPKPKSDEEIYQTTRQDVIAKFTEYKKTKRFRQFGDWVFRVLEKRNIVNPTPTERWDVYYDKLAEEREKAKHSQFKPRGIVAFADFAKQKEMDIESRAKHRSMDYFVTKFFDSIIESGGEITDYI